MTQTAHALEQQTTEMSFDERRARMATTATAVAAAHDGSLHRSLASAGWERRGLFQRLVKTQ